MENTDNLLLFRLFHQCAHRLHMAGKYRGQGRLLILLKKNGPLTQRELAEITGRRSATLSEQLENMDAAGYITREKNAGDRRNVDVALTPAGQAAAADAEADRTAVANELFGVLPEAEKEQLASLLQKLLSAWEELPRGGEDN